MLKMVHGMCLDYLLVKQVVDHQFHSWSFHVPEKHCFCQPFCWWLQIATRSFPALWVQTATQASYREVIDITVDVGSSA
jgi:hypothetical protein